MSFAWWCGRPGPRKARAAGRLRGDEVLLGQACAGGERKELAGQLAIHVGPEQGLGNPHLCMPRSILRPLAGPMPLRLA